LTIENITEWVNPVIKQYMREHNARLLLDYPSGEQIIIRSLNPESFNRITLNADLPPDPPDFEIPPSPPGGW
jgi:hypothetical protein